MNVQKHVYRDGDVECHGHAVWDDAVTGPRPGILLAHAWAGQTDAERERAARLAKLGFVGFALDVYGNGRNGSTKEENESLMTPFIEDRAMLRRRLLAGLEAMRTLDVVDTARCGAIGYCFGGLCVLDIARAGADVRGVVSFHGLLMGTGALGNDTIGAKILVLHGASDPMVPDDQLHGFIDEMNEAKTDWQIHMYGGAMHAFTNEDANDPDFGTVYHQDAERRSWLAMRHFFDEVMA